MDWKQRNKIMAHLNKINNDIKDINKIIGNIDDVPKHIRNASFELVQVIDLFKSYKEE